MPTQLEIQRPGLGAGRGLHRFALVLTGLVVLLISAGALVTSKGAGLSVPDWPLSYGSLNPPRWWEIDTVRSEHGHRLIAGTVALLSVVLAMWVAKREPRSWVRRLAYVAVAAVLSQALLGGITVLFFLPTPVSVSHAALAEIFFCLIVTLAVVTSSAWHRPVSAWQGRLPARQLAPVATAATATVFLQILLGAVMRHAGAGLAIPDFPLVFGGVVPPSFNAGITIHYLHRLGALAVLGVIGWTVSLALRSLRDLRVRIPAFAMAILVPLQIGLGGTVVLTSRAVLPNTIHVTVGALLLASTLALALFSWKLAAEVARARGQRSVGVDSPPREVAA